MRREVWSVSPGLGRSPQQVLEETFGLPEFKQNHSVWDKTARFETARYELTHLGDGEVRVVSRPTWFGGLFVMLFAGLPLLFLFSLESGVNMGLTSFVYELAVLAASTLSVFAVSTVLPSSHPEIRGIAQLQHYNRSALLPALCLPVLVLSWLKLSALQGHFLFALLGVGFFVSLIGYFVAVGAVPFVSVPVRLHSLRIPFSVIIWLLVGIILTVHLLFAPGRQVMYYEVIFDFYSQFPPSMWPSGALKDLGLQRGGQLVFYPVIRSIGSTYVGTYPLVCIVFYVVFHLHCWGEISAVGRLDLGGGGSVSFRRLLFPAYVVSGLVMLSAVVLLVFVVSFGFLGEVPVSDQALDFGQSRASETFSLSYESEERDVEVSKNPSSLELVRTSFSAFESADSPGDGFREGDWRPASIDTMLMFGMALWPVYLIIVGWMLQLVFGQVNKYWLILIGESVDREFRHLEDPPEVVVVDSDQVMVKPLSAFLGLRKFVVVSRPVTEKLGGKELEAVVAHESYHIENHDLLLEFLSSVLSPVFVGQNSVMAFYDYSQIEVEADDKAVDVVDERSTMVAITKLESLAVDRGGRVLFEDVSNHLEGEANSLMTVVRLQRRVAQVMYAPMTLLYSNILNDSAHLSAKERCERIQGE